MNSREIRASVEDFQRQFVSSPRVEHCFAPWYIHQTFKLAPTLAIDQSSDGSYDYSIDGFHVYYDQESLPHLVLIQAKFSDSIRLVAEGFRNFTKCLDDLANILEGVGSDLPPVQNKVLVTLKTAVAGLDENARKKLHIEFRVIHLCEEDSVLVGEKTKKARDDLAAKIEEVLPGRSASITPIAPAEMISAGTLVTPPVEINLSISGLQSVALDSGEKMYYGIANLAELVDLYKKRRENLFSRNVRYFIDTKQNRERGPAGKMRETLQNISFLRKDGDGGYDPEIFAFYHNGVSLTSKRVTPVDSGLQLVDPFVLNGCQTIKNAFLFRYLRPTKDRIDSTKWDKIIIPVRIVETTSESLIRDVTVNNNRQNAISASALHANDPIQISLESRFEQAGIFYERQMGAYNAIANSDPALLTEKYGNTHTKCYVDIETLARMLAAVAREITFAEHPTHIFESDKYKQCFSIKRTANIPLMVCLQNVHDIIGPILKNDLALRQIGEGPTPNRLRYYAIYLLFQYLAKRSYADFIVTYGATCGEVRGFREEIVKLFRESGIKDELKTRFMHVERNSAELLNGALKTAERRLRLSDRDPFATFQYTKVTDKVD